MKHKWLKLSAVGLTVILIGLFAVVALAADNSTNESSTMPGMQHNVNNDYDMSSMEHGAHSGHDMNHMNMSNPGGAAHEHGMADKGGPTDPWPILYGFGGINLAVILVAGIAKFTGVNGGK